MQASAILRYHYSYCHFAYSFELRPASSRFLIAGHRLWNLICAEDVITEVPVQIFHYTLAKRPKQQELRILCRTGLVKDPLRRFLLRISSKANACNLFSFKHIKKHRC